MTASRRAWGALLASRRLPTPGALLASRRLPTPGALLASGTLLALLSACSGGPSGRESPAGGGAAAPASDVAPPETTASRVAVEAELLSQAERLQSNLNAILAASSQVTGSWFVGDVTSEFSIFFDGDRETYAEERVTLGNSGNAWRQYFFEAGELTFYVEEGTRIPRGSGTAAAAGDSVVLILAFGASGEVRSFYKTVGGAQADLGESEVVLVRENLERLRQGARQAGP